MLSAPPFYPELNRALVERTNDMNEVRIVYRFTLIDLNLSPY